MRTLVLLSFVAACGSSPTPAPVPSPAPPPVVASVPSAPASAVAAAVEKPPRPVGESMPLHRVAEIDALHGLVKTESGLELVVGDNPGGGQRGSFWYVAWKDGRVDFERQTEEMHTASTTASTSDLFGQRPSYFFHEYSGFRGMPTDGYFELEPNGKWKQLSLEAEDGLVGALIATWSKGRLLEWRALVGMGFMQAEVILPRFRVVRGAPAKAPLLPDAMAKQLTARKFRTETVMAFTNGEVLAVGRTMTAGGYSTVYWKDEHTAPRFIDQEDPEGGPGESLSLIGGTRAKDARLMADGVLLGFAADGWKTIATPEAGTPPDVWFGEPLLYRTEKQVFLRRSADDPWHALEGVTPYVDVVVDAEGVVWAADEGALLSSVPVDAPATVVRAEWETSRKELGLSTTWSAY